MPEVSSENSTEDVRSGPVSQSVFRERLKRLSEKLAVREHFDRLVRRRKTKAQMLVEDRFAVLRTRVLREMRANGWSKLGVCSVSGGAGSTYIAANLALAAARRPRGKVTVVDLALSRPALADQLGVQGSAAFVEFLQGGKLPADVGTTTLPGEDNLKILALDRALPAGAEILQDEATRARIVKLVGTTNDSDLAIFDLSPVIGTDEGLAALPMMDAYLLIADGRAGSLRDMNECQRLLVDMPSLMGVVLNKAELLRT